MRFDEARKQLAAVGVALKPNLGLWDLHWKGVAEPFGTFELLEVAVDAGKRAAADRPEPLPPMGPVGRNANRRSQIIRHNRRLIKSGKWKA